jgi:benzoyl-CoA reductase/2-hydroxyglutaryl-CoA dehydratase subunit BcrC/BadD/HgdB
MDAATEKSLFRTREELNLYEPVLAALKLLPEGDPGRLQISILQTLIQQHTRTIECVETGEPFLASQYTNPVELLTAMDVHWYFHIQQMFAGSGTGGGIHIAEDLEAMDKLAVPGDCCTFLRLALYYQVEGLLPVPTAYLALTEPCDGIAGWHAAFIHHHAWRDVPCFAPDPPYLDDDRAIDYFAGEMKRMVDFITKHTGKTLDMDLLKRTVEETNKGYSLWMEYNEVRRSSPTPHGFVMPMSCFFQVNTAGAGDPSRTLWYEDMLADAERRVRENDPEIPNQKIRLLWYDIQPFYFGEITTWLQEEWGGVIAMDMVSYCPYELVDTSTEDSIFRGLARRAYQDGPMIRQARGKAENVVEDITRIVKDYNVDCVIFPGHMGHKDMAASSSIMADTCRSLGVPFLHIGMDQADRRYRTIDEIKDQITRFFRAMGLG